MEHFRIHLSKSLELIPESEAKTVVEVYIDELFKLLQTQSNSLQTMQQDLREKNDMIRQMKRKELADSGLFIMRDKKSNFQNRSSEYRQSEFEKQYIEDKRTNRSHISPPHSPVIRRKLPSVQLTKPIVTPLEVSIDESIYAPSTPPIIPIDAPSTPPSSPLILPQKNKRGRKPKEAKSLESIIELLPEDEEERYTYMQALSIIELKQVCKHFSCKGHSKFTKKEELLAFMKNNLIDSS